MKEIAIVALEYLEPDYVQTINCLHKCNDEDIDIFFASRDGVGNISRAFNAAFDRHIIGHYHTVWFITNIVFEPWIPRHLAKLQKESGFAAIHPACASSDHEHLWPGDDHGLVDVPFIELMAPLFHVGALEAVGGFQEELWYWYMDLVVSFRLKKLGWSLGCDRTSEVKHTYLRDTAAIHPITKVRKEMRQIMKEPSQQYMRSSFGENWKEIMGWKG